jgi:hypothetical protein
MDDAQVADLLSRALAAVDSAQIPDDLKEIAFTHALALLGAGVGPASGAGAKPGQTGTGNAIPTPAVSTDGGALGGLGLLDKIAAGLGVELDKVKRLFAEKDGAPQLIVKSSKLPKTKAAAAHDLALLMMAGRQLGGLDEYTEAEVLRDLVKRYGKFDQSNFAQQMKALDHYILTDGKGASAKRKLTHPGIEAATEMVEKYSAAE